MTTTVSNTTETATAFASLADLPSTLGFIAIALLIVLLVQKELIRAWGSARWSHQAQTLDVAIAPLAITAAVIVGYRVLTTIGTL